MTRYIFFFSDVVTFREASSVEDVMEHLYLLNNCIETKKVLLPDMVKGNKTYALMADRFDGLLPSPMAVKALNNEFAHMTWDPNPAGFFALVVENELGLLVEPTTDFRLRNIESDILAYALEFGGDKDFNWFNNESLRNKVDREYELYKQRNELETIYGCIRLAAYPAVVDQ
jgi:hypothetical protein